MTAVGMTRRRRRVGVQASGLPVFVSLRLAASGEHVLIAVDTIAGVRACERLKRLGSTLVTLRASRRPIDVVETLEVVRALLRAAGAKIVGDNR